MSKNKYLLVYVSVFRGRVMKTHHEIVHEIDPMSAIKNFLEENTEHDFEVIAIREIDTDSKSLFYNDSVEMKCNTCGNFTW